MNFHRLHVRNFKGLRDVDITFAPTGITLIHGPNETGKSSLVQAITTLFDEPINRTRVKLGHLVPKDGSGTPDITLEGETGPFRFSYRKRFLEDKTAELRLTSPQAETHSGREAQDRFDDILNRTLDRTLWRALMLQQGTALGFAEVRDQEALMSALDNAVSGPGAARDGENLFALVTEEYAKYYHSGHGGELQTLQELRKARDAAEAAVQEAVSRQQDLDGKIERARQLQSTLRRLEEQDAVDRKMRRTAAEQLLEVERLERLEHEYNQLYSRAAEARTAALRQCDDRRRLVESLTAAQEEAARAEQALHAARPEADEAAVRAAEARERLNQGSDNLEQRERLARLRDADYDHFRCVQDALRLRERLDASQAAQARLQAAHRELTGNTMTEAALTEIRRAENAVAIAHGNVESLAPTLTLEALSDCAVTLDGAPTAFTPGTPVMLPVAGQLALELPGILRLTMNAGLAGAALVREREAAEERLRSLLEKHDLASAADALSRLDKRRAAKRDAAEASAALAAGGGIAALASELAALTSSIQDYPASRPADYPMPPDLSSARQERDIAAADRGEAVRRRVVAEAECQVQDKAAAATREKVTGLAADHAGAVRKQDDFLRILEESRRVVADDVLAQGAAKADEEATAAAAALAGIRDQLRGCGADLLRTRLERFDAALAKTAAARTSTSEELAHLRGVLQQVGGDGLSERLEEAQAALQHQEKLLASGLRRAKAAKLLYSVMAEAREQTLHAYKTPLQQRIEDLARSVYRTDVSVTLTDDLRIAGRFMGGMDIRFEELSGGAREQFSLIHRAACGLTVAPGGGVPLILDDALGYSDNERLAGMNEVLMRAAASCQIIILSCMPGRFSYLEPAVTVDLAAMREKWR